MGVVYLLTKSKSKRIQSAASIIFIVFFVISLSIFSFLGINRSICLDEANSVYLASHPFGEIIEALKNDNSPPVYSFILGLWIRMFGISEFAIRSLSTIFYILSLPAIYILGRTFYSKKTGLFCVILYMISPIAIKHAQNARMYSLLGLLGIVSTLFFLKIFLSNRNSKKYLFAYIATNIVGTFTHYWFFLIILAQITSYFALFFDKASLRRFLVAVFSSIIPFSIFWTPVLYLQMTNGSTSWMVPPTFWTLGGAILQLLSVLHLLIIIIFLSLLIVNRPKAKVSRTVMLWKPVTKKLTLVWLIFFCVILLVPFMISQVTPIFVPDRYTIIALFPLVMFLASLLGRIDNRFLVMACCSLLLIVTATEHIILNTEPVEYSDRLTADYMIENVENNDILVFVDLSRLPIDYYFRLHGVQKHLIEIDFPSEIGQHPCWIDWSKLSDSVYIKQLEVEAEDLSDRLKGMLKANPSAKIYLHAGYSKFHNYILKDRLDDNFVIYEQHHQVIVYQEPS